MQLNMLSSFKESVKRGVDGRYEVRVPWIPGSSLSSTNEQPSRRRLIRVEKKLSLNPKLREEYGKIVRAARGRNSGGCTQNSNRRPHFLHATQTGR